MRNEIKFENGRRTYLDNLLATTMLDAEIQFGSKIISVNGRKIGKLGLKTPNQQYGTANATGKEVANRMRKSFYLKPFADKVEKMDHITAKELEELIPDYVPGWELRKALLGDAKPYAKKVWHVSYIDVHGKGKKETIELGRLSDKNDVQQALKRKGNVREVLSISEVSQAKHGAKTDESQTDLFDKSGVKYRAEVGGVGENGWSGNAMEYDTEDEAKDWLRGLASRWFGYNISRVVPTSTPTGQTIDLSDPLIFQNYRKNAKGTKFRTNSVAVKELIKDLENTPYGVGLALLRERLLTHADYDLKKHKKNPKTFENPIFSVGMYEDLFKRIHKELNFDVSKNNVKAVKDLIKDLASTPHEVGLGLLRERMVAYAENDLEVLKDNPKVFDNPIYNSGMYKDLFNRMIKFCDFGNLTSRVAKQGMKTPMIDIGSDNIARRGAKTQGVEWDKDSDSIRTQLGEFRVTITPQMQKGYYDVYVSANKKQIGKKYDVYGLENAKDIAFSMISNANKVAEGDMVGNDNTRYPRKADDTGKGIMEGWVIGDGNAYYEKEENALKSVKELGYKTIEEAYDNDEIYFTDWYDEDLDEQGYYYTANGKEVQISSKGSKLGGVIEDNWEMVMDEVSDEGSVGRILKNGKVVGQYEFDRSSDAFWIDPGLDKGQMSFDTKAELIDYYKESNKFANGGSIEKENAEMVLNNNKQISHHTQELASAVKGKSVPAWVVAKVNRSATDLSDATHYLEGTEKAKHGAKTGRKIAPISYHYEEKYYGKTNQKQVETYFEMLLKKMDKAYKKDFLNFDVFENNNPHKFFINISFRTKMSLDNFEKLVNHKFNPASKHTFSINEDDNVTNYKIQAKRGTKTSKGFMVFNYTDEIYASPDTFPTKAKANEFIAQFRKRFEGQGYYRDNRMNKVAPKDIDLLAIPEEFNPYKKN